MLHAHMHIENIVAATAAGLILARLAAQVTLSWLNRRHTIDHAGEVPRVYREFIEPSEYRKSIRYTLAKERFATAGNLYSTAVLLLALFSGILPWTFHIFSNHVGRSVWAMAAFLFIVGLGLSLLDLPFAWILQFRMEQRFGFNTTKQQTWWLDRVKVFFLSLGIGYPLLTLILKMATWGAAWWFWDWIVMVAVQLLLSVLAPVLILPLFNKLTPLPEGSLRGRLLSLASQTHFQIRAIQIMDGSKRSRHSNAFFTGFGRFRKIVLFDTLVGQLSETELEAVVAHEIGHYKMGHVPKMLVISLLGTLAGFYLLSLLARQAGFCQAFGFGSAQIAPAFLIFGLLAGTVGFWISPCWHWWSRRHEYQADAFAAHATGQWQSLAGALRKLHGKNLSNLVPHPLYSGFYYSHPTLLEREEALAEIELPGRTPITNV